MMKPTKEMARLTEAAYRYGDLYNACRGTPDDAGYGEFLRAEAEFSPPDPAAF